MRGVRPRPAGLINAGHRPTLQDWNINTGGGIATFSVSTNGKDPLPLVADYNDRTIKFEYINIGDFYGKSSQ